MRKIISYVLVFQLIVSMMQGVASPVFAETVTPEPTFAASNISMSRGGTVTHPTVVLNVDTGGQGVAGVTYERGYGKVAGPDSPRLYGVEQGVDYHIGDVYRYVSVYVQLADGSSARQSYELTGDRAYNSGSASFAAYPERPLTTDATTELTRHTAKVIPGSVDNGPILAVDDEVWVFGSNTGSVQIFKTADVFEKVKNNPNPTTLFLPAETLSLGSVLGSTSFDEHDASAIYDGRYVMAVNNSSEITIIEKKGDTKKVVSSSRAEVDKIFKNYGAVSSVVQAITLTQDAIYILGRVGGSMALYKATRQADGTYAIGDRLLTVPRYTGYHQDMVYDGTNIWITDNNITVHYYNTKTGGTGSVRLPSNASRLVYDGKQYVYAAPNEGITGTGDMKRINTKTNAVEVDSLFSPSRSSFKEDITFDGRNMWLWIYNTATENKYYYDLKDNVRREVKYAGSLNNSTAGVYDGQYLWSYQYWNTIHVTTEKKELKYGPSQPGLEKYFSEDLSVPKDVRILLDDNVETKPNYVDIKTVSGSSTRDIVQVLWSFDETESAAKGKDASFFRNMNNYQDDSAYRTSDYKKYTGNMDGKYFEVGPSSPYFPEYDESTAKFNFYMPSFPRRNGYYTVYMRSSDGMEQMETIYIDNYLQLATVKLEVYEVDNAGVEVTPANLIFKDIDLTREAGKKAVFRITDQIPTIEEKGYRIYGSETREVTVADGMTVKFWADKDLSKWGTLALKPYYMNGSEKVYIEYTNDTEKLYLIGKEYDVVAPHVEGYILRDLDNDTKKVTIQGGTEEKAGVNEVEFEFVPIDRVVVAKGIGVDASGNPTGEVAYNKIIEGDENTTIEVKAEPTSDKWELKGLVVYNEDGTIKEITTDKSYSATFGTDREVTFAYTRKQATITVKYVLEDGTVIGTDSYTPNVGEAMTIKAKDIPGYRLAEGENESIDIAAATDMTYEFEYVPNNVQIGVKGVEVDSSNELTGNTVYSEQVYGDEKSKVTVAGKTNLANWELVGQVTADSDGNMTNVTTDKSTEVTYADGQVKEVIFAYRRKMSTVTVKYVEDGTSNEVATADEFHVPLNSEFTGIARAVSGFKLKTPDAYQNKINVDETAEEIVFNYVRIKENVKIEARLDSATGDILAYDSIDLPLGSTEQKVTADVLEGMLNPRYVLKSESPVTIDVVKEDSVAVFVFVEKKSSVTIKYQDDAGTKIADDKTFVVPYGETIRVNAISIKDYYLKDNNKANFIKVADTATDGYTFVYTRSAGSASVIAKDADTGEILSYKVLKGTIGSTATINENDEFGTQSFYGYYKLNGANEQSVTYSDTHKEIIFNYTKQVFDVTVTAKDEDGNPLSFFDGNTKKVFSYKQGDDYKVYAPPVLDYEIINEHSIEGQNITENKTHAFTYRLINREVDIAVAFVTEEKEIVGATTISGERETEITVKAADHADLYDSEKWELIEGSDKTVTFGTDTVAQFVVKRKKVNLMVRYVNESLDDIATADTITGVDTKSLVLVSAKVIDNYQLVDGETLHKYASVGTTDMTTESAVKFKYKPASGNIRAEAVDENGNLLEIRYYNGTIGNTFAVSPKDFAVNKHPGYVYDGDDSVDVELTVDGDTSKNVITLVYKEKIAKIEVNYLDQDGKKIKTTKTRDIQYGESYEEYAPSLDNYNIDGEISYTGVVTDAKVVDGVISLTFTYELMDYEIVTDGVVNVIAKTKSGKILDRKSFRGTIGESVIYDANTVFGTFVGYKLIGNEQESVVFENGFVNIEFLYEEVKTTVTIVAKDTNGKTLNIPGGNTIPVQIGTDLTVKAPHIDGYIVEGVDRYELTNIKQAETVSFTYKHLSDVAENYMATLTVKGIDVADKSVFYEHQILVPFNKTYTVSEAPFVRNYEVTDKTVGSIDIGDYGTSDYTLTFEYKTKVVGAKAYYISDGTAVEGVPAMDLEDAIVGESVSATAKHINGYKYLGYTLGSAEGTPVSGVIGTIAKVSETPDSNGIYFHYKPIVDENVTIYAIEGSTDKDAVETSDRIIMSTAEKIDEDAVAGAMIAAPDLSNDAYVLKSATTKSTVKTSDGKYEVVFVYEKLLADITIKTYVNEVAEGNLISTYEHMTDNRVGESITVVAPHEGGYVLKEGEKEQKKISVDASSDNNSVTFVYDKLPQNSVEVQFVNESNEDEVINKYTVLGTKGELIRTKPIEMIGWKLATDEPEEQEVAVGDTTVTVTYKYAKDESKLTVEHYDDEGNKLRDDQTFMTPNTNSTLGYDLSYTAYAAHDIDGYILVDTDKDHHVFNDTNKDKAYRFIYQRIDKVAAEYMATLTIEGRDANNNNELLYTMKTYVKKGQDHTVNAVNLATYEVQGEKSVVVSIGEEAGTGADKTVTFTYGTLYRDVTSHYIHGESKEPISGVASKVQKDGIVGSPYTDVAQSIEGYYYEGYSLGSPTATLVEDVYTASIDSVKKSDNVIYFHYTEAKDDNVRIISVEGTEDSNVDPATLPIIGVDRGRIGTKQGTTLEVASPKWVLEKGYTLNDDAKKTIKYEAGTDTYTVYFYYEKKLATVTVKTYLKAADGTKEYINTHTEHLTDQRVLETVQVTPPSEPGYLTRESGKNITIKEGENIVEFEYEHLAQNTFMVKFLGKKADGTTELLTKYQAQGTIGDEIFITPITIKGWKAVDSKVRRVHIDENMDDVEILYEKDVATVKIDLVDKNGKSIPTGSTVQKEFETPNSNSVLSYELEHTVYAPHIPDWVLVEGEDQYYTFTQADVDNSTVKKFVYERIDDIAEGYMRTVSVKGTSAGKILYKYEVLVQIDTPNTIKALTMPTYRLADDVSETKEVTLAFDDKGATVEFKYVTTLSDVKVVSLYENGAEFVNRVEETKKDGVIGYPYKTNAPAQMDGYYYAGYNTTGELDSSKVGELDKSTIGHLPKVSDSGNNVIYFYYKAVDQQVLVIYKEKGSADGNRDERVIGSETMNLWEASETADVEYTLENVPDFLAEDHYEMIEGENYTETLKKPEGTTYRIITYYLKKQTRDINVKVVEKVEGSDDVILTEVTIEDARVGETIKVNSPGVVNYITPSEAQVVEVLPIDEKAEQEVVFVAEKMDHKSVNVLYESVDDVFIDSYQIEAIEGQQISVIAQDRIGWKVDPSVGLTQSAIAGTDESITFKFVEDLETVTVKYVTVDKKIGQTITLDEKKIETPKTNLDIDYTLEHVVYALSIPGYVLKEGTSGSHTFTESGDREYSFEYIPLEDILDDYTRVVNVTGVGKTKTGETIELYTYPVSFPINSGEQEIVIPSVERIYGYNMTVDFTDGEGNTVDAPENFTDGVLTENKISFIVDEEAGILNIQLNYDYVEPGKGRVIVEGRKAEDNSLLYQSTVQGDLEEVLTFSPMPVKLHTAADEGEQVSIEVTEEDIIQTFMYTENEPVQGKATVVYIEGDGVEIKTEVQTIANKSGHQYYSVPGLFYLDKTIYELDLEKNDVTHVVLQDSMTTPLYYKNAGRLSNGAPEVVDKKFYTIEASAGYGGTISPDGSISVEKGGSKTFTMTAEDGFDIKDVRVNGRSIGAKTSYTFKDVDKQQRIEVEFIELIEEPIKEKPALDKVNHNSYMTGLPNNRFGPTESMTRAQATVMFSRLLVDKASNGKVYSAEFNDMNGSEWYADEIGYMVELGIISGYPDGSFRGNQPITRGEFAVLASRFENLDLNGSYQFKDVENSYWAKSYVTSVVNKGWMIGYPDETFRPNNNITRAEVVTLVNRMLERQYDKDHIHENQEQIKEYVDVDESYWAYYEINEASNGHDYVKSEDGKNETWTILH